MPLQTSRRATHHRVVIPPLKLPLIRAQLEEERCFRIEQVATLTDELAAVGAGQARLEVTREVRSAARYSLIETEAAIARLEEGSYGTCQRCTEAVEWERLEAVPSTRLCRRCHSGSRAHRSRPRPKAALQAPER